MAKAPLFTLDPNPKFKLDIDIPRPGEKTPGVLTMHFVHHPIDEFTATMKATEETLRGLTEDSPEAYDVMVEALMSFTEGWGFPEEFNADTVRRLLVNYPRSFGVIHTSYYLELMGLREKN